MPTADVAPSDQIRASDTPDPVIDVFISYSRRDIGFARALEAALRRYRPPSGLPVPQRALRVFRDEADFTGVDYASAIRAHIGSAAHLVVLCSPAARGSRYVDEEIQLFAAARKPEDIIPVLVAGLPNNEAGPAQEAEKAFPEAMVERLTIPLAADYRGYDTKRPRVDRGGFEGPWHKLLADIYGLPRNEVEQREQRRRARLRLVSASVSGVIMMALAGLAGWALVSRQEAIRQRELAFGGLLTVEAQAMTGPEKEVAERQALLAMEARRIVRENGGSGEDALTVLSTALGRLPRVVKTFPPQETAPVLAFSGDGRLLFRAAGQALEVWNLGQMQQQATVSLPHPAVQFLPGATGRQLVAVDAQGRVTAHDLDDPTKEAVTIFDADASCVAVNPDGALVAALRPVSGARRPVEVRRAADGTIAARLLLPAQAEFAESCLALGRGTALLARYSVATPDHRDLSLLWPWVPSRDAAAPATVDAGTSPRRRDTQRTTRPFATWENIAGSAFEGDGERLVLVSPDSGFDGPGASRLGAIHRVSYGAQRLEVESIPFVGDAGSLAPGGWYFQVGIGIPTDLHQPLLNGRSTLLRNTIDAGAMMEIGASGHFSADGTAFFHGARHLIRRSDIATGRETLRFESAEPIARVVDAPAGRHLAVIGENNAVSIVDAAHPLEETRLFAGYGTQDVGGMLSDDGRVLAFAGGGLRLMRRGDGGILARAAAGSRVAVAAGGERAAGPFDDINALLRDDNATRGLLDLTRDGAMLWQSSGLIDAAFSPDGLLAAFAHADGRLTALDARDGRQLWQLSMGQGERAELSFSSDGRRLLAAPRSNLAASRRTGAAETLLVLEAQTGQRLAELPAGRRARLDGDGGRIAIAGESIGIVEVSSGRPVSTLPLPSGLGTVGGLAFLPDGRRLAMLVGSVTSSFLGAAWFDELAAFVHELPGGHVLARLPPGQDRSSDYSERLGEEEKAFMRAAQLSADGRRLAATLYPSRRAYWLVTAFRVPRDAVVWDLGGPAPREILRRPGMEVAGLSADGGTLLLRREGIIETWLLDRSRLAATLCDRVTRNLSRDEWRAWLGDRPYRRTCPERPAGP